MGAWSFLAPIIEEVIDRRPEFVGRSATASPGHRFAYTSQNRTSGIDCECSR